MCIRDRPKSKETRLLYNGDKLTVRKVNFYNSMRFRIFEPLYVAIPLKALMCPVKRYTLFVHLLTIYRTHVSAGR